MPAFLISHPPPLGGEGAGCQKVAANPLGTGPCHKVATAPPMDGACHKMDASPPGAEACRKVAAYKQHLSAVYLHRRSQL